MNIHGMLFTVSCCGSLHEQQAHVPTWCNLKPELAVLNAPTFMLQGPSLYTPM